MENNTLSGKKIASFVIGFFLFQFFLIAAIGLNKIAGYIDIPSFLFNFGITISSLIIAFGFSGIKRYIINLISLLFFANNDISDMKYLMQFSNLGFCLSVLSGILGSLIGLINILSRGFGDKDELAAYLAVMLITAIYGLFAALLFKVVYYKALAEKEKLS